MKSAKKRPMKGKIPGRILFVFFGIGIIFVVQMAWWIVFFVKSVSDDVRERYLGMLVSEGIFFFVLIALGLILIYRVLRHQVFLKNQFQDFFAGFSHELKTPLASMKLQLETLLAIDLPEVKRRKLQENMLEDVERLELSLENILDVFRYESGALRMVTQQVDIDGWLEHTVESLISSYQESGFQVKFDLRSQTMVAIDDRYFITVVANLMQNSVRYSEVDPVLHIESELAGDQVVLTFRDEGIGLESGDADMIFQKYYRVDNDSGLKHKGAGLGLYLSRQIVKAHDGTISVCSKGRNQGTCFVIKLNRVKGA